MNREASSCTNHSFIRWKFPSTDVRDRSNEEKQNVQNMMLLLLLHCVPFRSVLISAFSTCFRCFFSCLLYLQLQKQADKSEQEDANEHISLAVVSNWKYEHSIPRSIALPHRFIMSLRVGAFRFGLKISITTCASTSASVWLRAKKRARRKCGRLFQRGRKGRWRVSRQQRPDLVPWG